MEKPGRNNCVGMCASVAGARSETRVIVEAEGPTGGEA
jgi:hypothetical protein